MVPVFGVVYALLREMGVRVKPMSWLVLALLLAPIANVLLDLQRPCRGLTVVLGLAAGAQHLPHYELIIGAGRTI
jgi:hypothetical protein